MIAAVVPKPLLVAVLVVTFSQAGFAGEKEPRILKHDGWVAAVAFSPDGKTLAAAGADWKKPSKVKLWDTTTWQERAALPCPGEILCLAYSPQGEWLAVGSWDRTVRLFPQPR